MHKNNLRPVAIHKGQTNKHFSEQGLTDIKKYIECTWNVWAGSCHPWRLAMTNNSVKTRQESPH